MNKLALLVWACVFVRQQGDSILEPRTWTWTGMGRAPDAVAQPATSKRQRPVAKMLNWIWRQSIVNLRPPSLAKAQTTLSYVMHVPLYRGGEDPGEIN